MRVRLPLHGFASLLQAAPRYRLNILAPNVNGRGTAVEIGVGEGMLHIVRTEYIHTGGVVEIPFPFGVCILL